MRGKFFKFKRERPIANPFFDWFDDKTSTAPSDSIAAYGTLRAACMRHVESGGQIVRYSTGLERNLAKTILGDKPIQDTVEPTTWRALAYTSPFGALLDGTPAGLDSLTDAYLLLKCDQLWLIGCLHGIDGTGFEVTGKRAIGFSANEDYKAGRNAGERLADEFIKIVAGYDPTGELYP